MGQNGAESRCTLTARSHPTVGRDRLFVGNWKPLGLLGSGHLAKHWCHMILCRLLIEIAVIALVNAFQAMSGVKRVDLLPGVLDLFFHRSTVPGGF
jgi:hypothetical protein